MARYLSREWFAEVQQATPDPQPATLSGRPTAAGGDGAPTAVLEQVVRGGPDGTVTYRVELTAGQARIVWPVPEDAPPADLRLSCDWPTAVSVAKGELSTQRALMQGRLRLSGNPGRLASLAGEVQGLDPLPQSVRQDTTYAPAP